MHTNLNVYVKQIEKILFSQNTRMFNICKPLVKNKGNRR